MFDIGFWELIIIAVVGIVVVGPERLPEVVRVVMRQVRKIRRMFDDVRYEVERELHLDEVRRAVDTDDLQEHIKQLNQEVMEMDSSIRSGGKQLLEEIDAEVRAAENALKNIGKKRNPTASEAPDPEAHRDSGIEHPRPLPGDPAPDNDNSTTP